jgi:flagellar biosynthesis protein FlhG
MLKEEAKKTLTKTIAVTSGKGGVGKTNIVSNIAIAMKKAGQRVLVIDADLGLSNIDVLLNLAPKYNLRHVINGEKTIRDIVIDGPHGIKILPASSGEQELTVLDKFQKTKIIEALESLKNDVDVLFIDTAAGISENVTFFCLSAQEIVIVTSPEPTAITDAYALIKVLLTRYQKTRFSVLVNSVKNNEEASDIFKRFSLATERFLKITPNYLGFIPYDESVQKAAKKQVAFVDAFPKCLAAKEIFKIASKLQS